jgi:nitrite reductase (NADH) large subunit
LLKFQRSEVGWATDGPTADNGVPSRGVNPATQETPNVCNYQIACAGPTPDARGGGRQRHGRPSLLRGAGAGRRRSPLPHRCIGEEPRPAYDRVHLSEFFSGRTAEDLRIADPNWYALQGVGLRLGDRVVAIDRTAGAVETAAGARVPYDALVLATGSSPFVPSLPGIERPGVFVYRTIEDLEAIRAWGATARRAAVIGGGLLGLEAAKAVRDMGLETHVVEFAPRLMPRQVDAGGGEVLRQSIERLGVRVHVGAQTEAIDGEGDGA